MSDEVLDSEKTTLLHLVRLFFFVWLVIFSYWWILHWITSS